MAREQTFTIPPDCKLWATAECDGWLIPFYVSSKKSREGYEGVTYVEKADRPPYVLLYPSAFRSPEILDETLLHEWFHVIEYLLAHELRKPDPEHCTQWARVGGKAMASFVRTFKQVG